MRCQCAATLHADAVQFIVKAEIEGVMQIAWSLERDHHPVAVGLASETNPATGDAILDMQIQAFARITRRR